MKTTIELPDALFGQARRYADSHNMTMKALIEQSLREIMAEKKEAPKFRLRDASVKGHGLSPEFRSAAWEQIGEAIYKGRGA